MGAKTRRGNQNRCAVGDSNPGLKLISMEGFNANHYTNGACPATIQIVKKYYAPSFGPSNWLTPRHY